MNNKIKQEIEYLMQVKAQKLTEWQVWKKHSKCIMKKLMCSQESGHLKASKTMQCHTRCHKGVVCVLQEPFKKEVEKLQYYQILAPLGIDEKAK